MNEESGILTAKAYIKQLRTELTDFYGKVSKVYSTDAVINELMMLRGYTSPKMYELLKEIGVFKISALSDCLAVVDYTAYSTYKDWHLEVRPGYSMLSNRYVFPIRDFSGQVTALVGWLNTDPKYAVTPTLGFVKDTQFFNAECYKTYVERGENTVYLVEGFFDALSLRSEGFCALGNFGLLFNGIKAEILKRFDKVVIISDADTAGRRAYPYIEGGQKARERQWHISNPKTFVKIQIEGVKDADDLIKYYDCRDEIYELRNKGPVAFLTA